MQTKIATSRELTGRAVLIWFIAFFGVVFAVNGVMMRLASSTFAGVETEGAYKLGLAFNAELAAARSQDRRHWNVSEHIARNGDDTAIELTIVDPAGKSLDGLSVDLRLVHPADARLDHTVAMQPVGNGKFRGAVTAHAGQWDLVADLRRGEEHLFRSKSRVALR